MIVQIITKQKLFQQQHIGNIQNPKEIADNDNLFPNVSPEGTDGDFYSFPHISHYCSIYRTCRKKQAMSIKQQAENKYNLCRQFAKLLPTTFEFVNYCPFGALFDMDIPIQSTRPLGVSRQ